MALSKESLIIDDNLELILGGIGNEDNFERSPSYEDYQRGWYYQRDVH
jgi:hypothetical protein